MKPFEKYIRTGVTIDDSENGVLMPKDAEDEVNTRLKRMSPIRDVATIQVTSGSLHKKPIVDGSNMNELNFPTMELYAIPAATSTLLEDAAVDIDQWIASEVDRAFAEQETEAFVKGDGINKPRGFLTYETVPEKDWKWGTIGNVDFNPNSPNDSLIDTIYSLKAGYRQNACWSMNRKTQALLRRIKDEDGNYIWQPPANAGSKASLLGFPVIEVEDMPDFGNGDTPIVFGDFKRAYMIVDRQGTRVLRDPYSAKPYVLFYTTKRVGGGVQDFDAIKLVRVPTWYDQWKEGV